VTDGEPARRDLGRHYGLARERTAVVPCGADEVFRPPADGAAARAAAARLGARPPYLLYVGGHARHKNLDALVRAFARAARRDGTVTASLVIAGPGEGFEPLLATAAALGVGDAVRHAGFPDDAALAGLYQAAEALVLPSLREGFGLPAVEAVACGTPAVVTRESPLPGLLGDAALAIDPRAPDDLARALDLVLHDAAVRERQRAAARARAGAFSWSRSADAMRAVLAEAVAAQASRRWPRLVRHRPEPSG
jgi:glycosyltransferase involved in cell wall biosynthesis